MTHRLLFGSLVSLAALSACAPASAPLADVGLSRQAIYADGTARQRGIDLTYELAAPAMVDISLVSADGARFELRRAERRPARGRYVLSFDGTYPLASGERRVAPSGDYKFEVRAANPAMSGSVVTQMFSVVDADSAPPQLLNLAASPARISPDFDGVDDVAFLSYRLTKQATITHYARDQRGKKVWFGPVDQRSAGEYSLRWNALAEKRPLPDGLYQLTVEARDRAGNLTTSAVAVGVEAGTLPQARILAVDFSPRHVLVGGTVRVEVTVENTGAVALQTQGPAPGYTYSSYDNYFSIADHAFVDRAGRWRIGVDWAGSPSTAGGKYPYRWGFGEQLNPGQRTVIVGYIRILHEDQRAQFADQAAFHKMWFFTALVQEGVAIHQDRVGGTEITVDF